MKNLHCPIQSPKHQLGNTVTLVLAVVVALVAGLAHAINKCQTPDGRTVFQDMPCVPGQGGKIEVKPASGAAPETTAIQDVPPGSAVVPAARPRTEAQRIEAQADTLRKENRLHFLQVRALPDAYAAIDQQKGRCNGELANLRTKKQFANNNLAGATWEQSISSEMSAVVARCDSENRSLTRTLDILLKEEADIKAVLGK